MALYRLLLKTSAKKELRKIPKKDSLKILNKIEKLAENPRPEGATKLSYHEKYRLRQGNYRIIYSIEDKELIVWVVKVAHRKEIYKHLC